ncbi:DNA replication/repair protein RecF [Frankia sp. CcI49]|uniref:DNA replication/repair protein RecF n=1 Tax=unclassified Frankia TaxID=2632575 RepID=UPI0006CA480B|nr:MULTISPECIES: DNA replication/repair protein RecF [unclassified Frankia]KPM52879.1 DNA recombination protein RecF [Frankia sp. R43]ONH57689.1 DNA replication/repair protein RecF [Frankia sp. CcI49]
MHLTHLSLTDFRSYPRLDLVLEPGVTTFVGSNGQGKTNLIEAIGFVATLGSHRVATDAPLVREGTTQAVVRSRIVRGDRAALVEIQIVPGKANRVRLNRAPVPRARDVAGLLATVLFAPEDLALVKGDPAERRRFLDELLVARSPRMAAVQADYERVLKQRSALLRTAGAARRSGGRGDLRTLDVWDGHLADHGAELLAARLALVEELRPRVRSAYAAVAGEDSPTDVDYRSTVPYRAIPDRTAAAGHTDSGTELAPGAPDVSSAPTDQAAGPAPSAGQAEGAEGSDETRPGGRPSRSDLRAELAEAILTGLAAVRSQEIERGVTLVGPHRDDLLLSVKGRPARGYASHGESWSLALALRLASYDLLRADDREPVLLLDDVFAELDVRRRARLAALVAPAEQVLVTAAVEADVPAELAGVRFEVSSGEVRRVG